MSKKLKGAPTVIPPGVIKVKHERLRFWGDDYFPKTPEQIEDETPRWDKFWRDKEQADKPDTPHGKPGQRRSGQGPAKSPSLHGSENKGRVGR